MVSISTSAHAQQRSPGDRWQFEVTPYIFGAGMSGSVKVNDKPLAGATVEESFSDVLNILKFALMGSFEARKGRWGVATDGMYFKVGDGGTITGDRGLVSVSATADIAQQVYSVAGAFRTSTGRNPVDVVGGLRYVSVGWDVDITASVPGLPVSARSFKETKDWVDPYLGARARLPLGTRWSMTAYGDVGGFGVGSKVALQGLATVNYAFTPGIEGRLGYRYISTDYDKDGFQYDMTNAGFVMGASFRW